MIEGIIIIISSCFLNTYRSIRDRVCIKVTWFLILLNHFHNKLFFLWKRLRTSLWMMHENLNGSDFFKYLEMNALVASFEKRFPTIIWRSYLIRNNNIIQLLFHFTNRILENDNLFSKRYTARITISFSTFRNTPIFPIKI